MALKSGTDGPTYETHLSIVKFVYPKGGGTNSQSPTTVTTGSRFREYIGRTTPGYHGKVKRGELIPHTPFQQFECFGSAAGHWNTLHYPPGLPKAELSIDFIPDWAIMTREPNPGDLAAYSPHNGRDLVNEAAAAIYSEGWDSLTFVAELTQVRRLFMSTGSKLLSMHWPSRAEIRRTLQGLLRSKAYASRKAANEWLSVRYGWRPLLYDMKSLSEALRRLGKARMVRHRKQKRSTFSTQVASDVSDYIDFNNGYDHYHIIDSVRATVHGTVCADIEVPDFQFNPLQTAWELIQFSFVIDWFLSVGKSIAALSLITLSSAYTASWSYRVNLDRDVTVYRDFVNMVLLSGSAERQERYRAVFDVRHPCSIPLIPHLTCRLDWKKIIDLVFLIAQRRKGN